PGYMLDNAETCLAVLGDLERRLARETAVDLPTVASIEEAPEAPAAELEPVATAVMPMPVVASDAEHLDPELLELFIEEAKEEIVSIQRNLPQWSDSPDDMETLITVR